MNVYCDECHIRFAVSGEKILYEGKLVHRSCLAARKKVYIKDADLVLVDFKPGVYKVYKYTQKL